MHAGGQWRFWRECVYCIHFSVRRGSNKPLFAGRVLFNQLTYKHFYLVTWLWNYMYNNIDNMMCFTQWCIVKRLSITLWFALWPFNLALITFPKFIDSMMFFTQCKTIVKRLKIWHYILVGISTPPRPMPTLPPSCIRNLVDHNCTCLPQIIIKSLCLCN